MKRPRGTGSIFRMNNSNMLWVKYYRNGKPIRESAHTAKPKEAANFLRKRLGEISSGTFLGLRIEKIKDC
jgi:hypothetical protein